MTQKRRAESSNRPPSRVEKGHGTFFTQLLLSASSFRMIEQRHMIFRSHGRTKIVPGGGLCVLSHSSGVPELGG
jgi:hypothetical protein